MSTRLDQAVADWNRSAERESMLLLGRAVITEPGRERISALLPNGIHVEQLLEISDRHYVLPLVIHHLLREAEIPSDLFETLEHLREERGVRSRQLADEMLRIVRLLETAGIPVVPYKGPALGHLFYGDSALRSCIDLDFLVSRAHSERARDLLLEQGYRPVRDWTPPQERMASQAEAHHQLLRENPDIHVDLHWQLLADYTAVRFDSDAILARARRGSIEGVPVRVFRPEDQLLILAAHAAKHFYERFIWINDLDRLLQRSPEMDWLWVLQEAGRLGILRILRIGFRLAEQLLQTELPEQVLTDLRSDSRVDPLAADVLRCFWTVPLDGASWSRKTRWFLQARERWRDRTGYLWGLGKIYLTPTSNDWEAVRLPDRLFFLYYALRPLRVGVKYFRRVWV